MEMADGNAQEVADDLDY